MNKPAAIQRVLLLNPFLYSGHIRNVSIDPVVARHAGQEIKTGVTFPYGLASMSAMLTIHDIAVRLIDPIAVRTPIEHLREAAEWADAIVIPFSPFHQEDTLRFFAEFPHKVRIFTGDLSRYLADFLLGEEHGDIILVGEPEETIVELCHAWPSIEIVRGLIHRGPDGRPHQTPERPPIANLDLLPFPDRDFADPARYWDLLLWGRPAAFVLTSRGCPYNCVFCAQWATNHQNVRFRSPANVVDEIQHVMERHRVTDFIFHDEMFNLKDDFAMSVCAEIVRRRLSIRWVCAARGDRVRPAAVSAMKKAGCTHMLLGLESANDTILAAIKKDQRIADVQRGIDILHQERMPFSLQCIFGSPGETAETIAQTLRFVRKAKPFFVSYNVLTPLPGSQLFEQVRDQIDLKEGLKDMDILHTRFPFSDMRPDVLAKAVRHAYLCHYCTPSFLLRMGWSLTARLPNARWLARVVAFETRYFYQAIWRGLSA